MYKGFAIVSTLFLISCFSKRNSLIKVARINEAEVSFIGVTCGGNRDTICVLNSNQTSKFIQKFNKASHRHLVKMIPHYIITVNFKDGGSRSFRENNGQLKEGSDFAFSLKDKNYIKKLFNENDKMILPLSHEIKYPFYKEDGYAFKAKLDYSIGIRNYYLLGFLEYNKFQEFYEKYLKLNYNINLKYSCNPTYIENVYYNAMNKEVENEYGDKFIDSTQQEAKILFKQ